METKQIKNIIFDLGGVIINLDLDRTTRTFAELAGKSFEEVQKGMDSLKVFYKYEVGELTDAGFRELVRSFVGAGLPDDKIDFAWNRLLLDIPKERIELIKTLKDKYRIFVLSNTNYIHFVEVENILKRYSGVPKLSDLFEKVYLSYEIHMAKPFPEIYEYVLKDAGIGASETLFIDDNLHNIEAASRLGINTIHLQPPTTILDIFNGERFF